MPKTSSTGAPAGTSRKIAAGRGRACASAASEALAAVAGAPNTAASAVARAVSVSNRAGRTPWPARLRAKFAPIVPSPIRPSEYGPSVPVVAMSARRPFKASRRDGAAGGFLHASRRTGNSHAARAVSGSRITRSRISAMTWLGGVVLAEDDAGRALILARDSRGDGARAPSICSSNVLPISARSRGRGRAPLREMSRIASGASCGTDPGRWRRACTGSARGRADRLRGSSRSGRSRPRRADRSPCGRPPRRPRGPRWRSASRCRPSRRRR